VYVFEVQEFDLKTLITRLEYSNFGQRQTLVEETVRVAGAEELAAIARLLGHESEAVRIGAIEILEAAGFHQALRHLAAVTVQRQGQERAFAARAVVALARAEDRALLEPVVRAWLRHDDPYLEIHANNLCARLNITLSDEPAAAPGAPAAEGSVALRRADAGAVDGAPRAPGIAESAGPIAGITSPDAAARKQAIARTLSGLDNPAAALVDGLFDTRSPGVRLDLVNALCGLAPGKVVPVLPRILRKGDGDLLALVARSLEPRLDDLPEVHIATVQSALEYGRGRMFDHALACDAIDRCLIRLRRQQAG
jgi:hypothetical protein